MSHIIDVHEAAVRLDELLALYEAGEDVLIARSGKPVARLAAPPRQPGMLEHITEFDDSRAWEPMAPEELAEWEDGPVFPR
jgi:antitoxin (DNA-binding transcriptional repressor) of toxin-antitoxin stability system